MLEIFSISDIGGRASQQDVIAALHDVAGIACGLVLCDGAGGLADGDKAAQLTCDACHAAIAQHSLQGLSSDPLRILGDAIAVSQRHVQSLDSDYCASTVTMALIAPPYAFIAWVGDSPVWLYSDRCLIRISSSHGLPQEQWRAYQISGQELGNHEQSNVITRAINKGSGIWSPDMRAITVKPGDQLILASDGLDAVLTDEEIEKVLHTRRENTSSAEIVQTLIDAALGRNTSDNVSVGVIRVLDPTSHAPEIPATPAVWGAIYDHLHSQQESDYVA